MRKLLISLCGLICLLAGCSGAALPPARGHDAVGFTERVVGLVNAFGGDVNFTQNQTGPPTAHLRPGGWVQYNSIADTGYRNESLQIAPLSPEGGEFPGEYWVGLQDRGKQRWQWFGPFASYGASSEPIFGDQSYRTVEAHWDLVTNSNTVVVYCTKPFAMGFVRFAFLPSEMP